MNCPYCNSKLKEGIYLRYQDSLEHVSSPNREPLEKPTWVCKSPTCVFSALDVFWDAFGDFYTGEDWYNSEFDGIKKLLLNNTTAPGNSLALKLTLEDRARAQRSKELTIGNFKWYVEKNHVYSEAGLLLKRKYAIGSAKRNGLGGSWSLYLGFWRMLFFSVGRFHESLKRYAKGDLSHYEEKNLLKEFSPLEEWQEKDNYRKVYKWYVNTFFKGLKKELKYDL